MQYIKVKLDEGAKAPTRAYPTDAGLDLYAREDAKIANIEGRMNVLFMLSENPLTRDY